MVYVSRQELYGDVESVDVELAYSNLTTWPKVTVT